MFSGKLFALLALAIPLCASPVLAAELDPDPMRPPSAGVAGVGGNGTAVKKERGEADTTSWHGHTLSAIRIAHSHRSATIDGKHVTVGGRVGAARVIAIQADGVTLRQGGREFTVTLLPHKIKKPVEATQP